MTFFGNPHEPVGVPLLPCRDFWHQPKVQAGSLVCFCDIQDQVRPLGFEIGGKEFWLRPAETAEMDNKLSLFCPVDMTHDAKKGSDTLGDVPFWMEGDHPLVTAITEFLQSRKLDVQG